MVKTQVLAQVDKYIRSVGGAQAERFMSAAISTRSRTQRGANKGILTDADAYEGSHYFTKNQEIAAVEYLAEKAKESPLNLLEVTEYFQSDLN